MFVSLQGDLLRHPERRCSPAFCNIEGKQVRSAGNYPLFSSVRACGRMPAPPAPPPSRAAGRRGGGARSGAPQARGEPRAPGIVAAPAYKAWRRPPLGAAFLSPPFQLPPGKGSACLGCEWRGRGEEGGGGGWGTRFPRSKQCSETVAEKIKVSSLFLSSPVPFLPPTRSFVSIQEKSGESPN